jgi:hypothetical protein
LLSCANVTGSFASILSSWLPAEPEFAQAATAASATAQHDLTPCITMLLE